MPTEEQSVSIVVVGQMNPGIHHPSWYRQIGVINETVERHLIDQAGFACTPDFSVFNSAEFSVSCERDKWQIQSANPAQIDTLHSITLRVFDDKLHETRISAIGYNFDFHVNTQAESASRLLAKVFPDEISSGLDQPINAASYIFELAIKHPKTRCQIDQSVRAANMIYMRFNNHFAAPSVESFQVVDLMKPTVAELFERSQSLLQDIVVVLNKQVEESATDG